MKREFKLLLQIKQFLSLEQKTEHDKALLDKDELKKQVSKLHFSIGYMFGISQTNAKTSVLPESAVRRKY